jgi:hypothetical protein
MLPLLADLHNSLPVVFDDIFEKYQKEIKEMAARVAALDSA